MKFRMRALLLWVMVLAMPLQGMAASLMLFCGPSHQRMAQGLAWAMPAHEHGQGLPHEHAAPHAAAAQATPDSATVAGAAADLGGFAGAAHADFNCSACAACCPVLAPPASFALPAAPEPGHAFAPAAGAAVPSHTPDGLDRPPRVGRA